MSQATGAPPTVPGPALPVRRRRQPWWWWTLWLALLLLLSLAAARARFTTDLGAMLPGDDAQLNRIMGFLKGRSTTRVLAVEGTAGAPGTSLAAVRDALAALVPQVAEVGAHPLPPTGPASMVRMMEVVEAHLPVLVDASDLQAIGERLQGDRLHAYLAALKERISRPEDAFTAAAAQVDVLAVGGQVLQGLARSVAGTQFDRGILTHPSLPYALLPLDVDFDPGDVHRTALLMQRLDACCSAAAVHGVHLEVVGSYRHFNDNMSSLAKDFFSTIPLGIGLILLVLFSLARSALAVTAMLLPALFAVVAAVAALALGDGVVAYPLIGFAASLLGVAVDYGIQMTTALGQGRDAAIHRPLLRSCIISVCAFAALISSPVPALHSLGIMVVAGLAMAYVSARWLLPAIVPRRPRGDPWRRVTGPLLVWCEGHRATALVLAAGLSVATGLGLTRLHLLNDLERMDGSSAATRAALDGFLTRWGALESSDFLVTTQPDLDHALAILASARTTLHLPPSRLERFLPDLASQARHQADWNRFWQARAARFRQDFAAQCHALGMRPAAFATSLARYAPGPLQPLQLADWDHTPLALTFTSLIIHAPSGWQVASPVDTLDQAGVEALPARAEAAGLSQAWVATRRAFAERLVAVLRDDLARRGCFIALAIVIAVVVLVRRLRPILAMLVPPAVALLWTFGLLGWIGAELTPFSVLVAAFVGGIGIDCAVFLTQAEDRPRLISPVIACIATAIAGTAAMVTAHHPLLAGVGETLTIGMSACLVSCLLLTPALAGRGPRRPAHGEPGGLAPLPRPSLPPVLGA